MSEPVKPPRTYRSEARRSQAERTRTRVLDAAERLCIERGYGKASIAAIAAAAGVSAETVYAGFGSKRNLFAEIVQRAVRGDDPQPVLQQAEVRAVMTETDQRTQLRLFAEDIVRRLERVGPLMELLGAAAREEPELAALRDRLHTARHANLASLVDALSSNGPLRLEAGAAAESVWALASPELHRLLTGTRGWSRARYTSWLSDSLARVLLPD